MEQWDVFEVALKGPTDGNPFVDVTFAARFTQGGVSKEVAGFYDGEGMYRVRFMPEQAGRWRYETMSNRAELDKKSGEFSVARPTPKNHGPVRVAGMFHFAYADGAPFRQIGTTCYAWIHQGDALEEQTLASLAAAPFNKLRMCVFPKSYAYNENEPVYYPFQGAPPNKWDFERFNPKFFQHLEKRVGQLRDLGIEADVILFHPYDKGHWGFDRMGAAADDRYLRYLVARLAAYRNVWWSLANEFDFIKEKSDADWDRLFQIVQDSDPYGHLRSIHNGSRLYNHTLPWVTHASIQNGSAVEDFGRAALYRDVYRKPIVFDEVKYEGNIDQRWGQLTAEEMVHRFWQGAIAGTYVGHGETYLDPHDVLWWSKGGALHGQSPARIEFLKKVLESAPPEGLEPIDKWEDPRIAGKAGEYYLIYFGKERPAQWIFKLPRSKIADGARFRVEILDTWNMTITPVDGVFKTTAVNRYVVQAEENRSVNLPGTPYMALRIRLTD
ncbi:MAG: DUF5605 domain-containing protein [Thermoguttaceae bacterium]